MHNFHEIEKKKHLDSYKSEILTPNKKIMIQTMIEVTKKWIWMTQKRLFLYHSQ